MLRLPCWNALPDPPSPRPPAANARHGSPYEDHEDPDPATRSRHEQRSSAGMIGFILSLVPLGLLLIIGILWYALHVENRQHDNAERTRIMVYWFALLDIASFFMALAATLFASRGLSPTTSLYPGWSLAALIMGIGEIVITVIIGLGLFCCVSVLEIARMNGG